MSSRADTCKVAQADLETADRHLANARRGHVLFNLPVTEAENAILLLERSARRLRRAFGLEGA